MIHTPQRQARSAEEAVKNKRFPTECAAAEIGGDPREDCDG